MDDLGVEDASAYADIDELVRENEYGLEVVERPQFVFREKLVYDFFKRIFDIVFSALAIIILSPIFLMIATIIKLNDRGSVIYRQERIGKSGKPFSLYKFRTMVVNADQFDLTLTPEQVELYKKEYKLDDDPRITRIGKFLRGYSLDELPQFINSLFGDMSVIGPRPLLEEETEYFEPYKELLLKIKPGISGYWQVNGRSNITYNNFSRQSLELFYIEHRSFILDIKIIWSTFWVMVRKIGAK